MELLAAEARPREMITAIRDVTRESKAYRLVRRSLNFRYFSSVNASLAQSHSTTCAHGLLNRASRAKRLSPVDEVVFQTRNPAEERTAFAVYPSGRGQSDTRSQGLDWR
ncbi:hypothetical protein KM043_016533 [Ampulex compressa]|nr:hypothetical protein KM043_016533 [Ampulex compressa]